MGAGTAASLAVAVSAAMVYVALMHWQHGSSAAVVMRRSSVAAEHDAWNGSVPLSFPRARPVPQVMYNASADSFVSSVMSGLTPVVIRGSPALHWKAIRTWRDPRYLARLLGGQVKAHTPSQLVVRVHHTNQAFETLANWTRPFVEASVSAEELQRGDMLLYAMLDVRKLPKVMEEISLTPLSVPWRAPLEVNLWAGGTSGITTPAHYDMVHNVYTQVVGYKRFILFPPEDTFNLYTFTHLHPSARQTQVDFNNDTMWSRFPNFARVQAREVVLGPGDVLYIPPFTFHQVAVVSAPGSDLREAVSVSVSVHTTCPEVDVRSNLIDLSLRLPVPHSWSKENRVCALFWHFAGGVFASAEERTSFVKSVLESSFSHFDLDDGNAPGLFDKIKEARRQFSASTRCEDEAAYTAFAVAGRQARRLAKSATNLAFTSMLMNGYLQEVTELLLGPLDVDPFLRWLQQHR